jgi:hypothetical protein
MPLLIQRAESPTENPFVSVATIKTTGLAGGMHHAFKAMIPAARHGL